jgi:hypothetical protein
MNDNNLRLTFIAIICLLPFLTSCDSGKIITKIFPPEKSLHYSAIPFLTDKIPRTEISSYAFFFNPNDKLPVKLVVKSDLLAVAQDHIDIVAKEKLFFFLQVPPDITEKQWQTLKALNAETMTDMKREDVHDLLAAGLMLYVSRDGEHWAPVNGGKAMKEVLGYQEGQISFGMGADKDEGLTASLVVQFLR